MAGGTELLLATRDLIRAPVPYGLGLNERYCDVMPNGKPKPNWGDVWSQPFLAIHGLGWNKELPDDSYNRVFSYSITMTWFINSPFDAVGWSQMVAEQQSMVGQIEALAGWLQSQQWGITNLANIYLGTARQGFSEAVYPSGCDYPAPVNAEWFGAHSRLKKVTSQGMFHGVAATLKVSGARLTASVANANL